MKLSNISYEKRLAWYLQGVEGNRVVKTNLKGEDQYEILSSVLGQCSDGIWENNAYMEPYWQFCNVVLNPDTDQVEIAVSSTKQQLSWYKRSWIKNPYTEMTNQEIRNWFARKIKTIINIEAKDNNMVLSFSKKNEYKMLYLGTYNNTVSEAVEVYNTLRNFETTKILK